MSKVNLSLLRELVEELETSIDMSYESFEEDEEGRRQFIIDMSKAAGLAGGIMQEAQLLVLDIQAEVRKVQVPAPKISSKGGDGLLKILGLTPPNKGGNNDNGMN